MAKLDVQIKELSSDVKKAIAGLKDSGQEQSTGVVTRVGDGVAWVYGLRDCGYSEMLQIEGIKGTVTAFALNLLEDEIGAVLLGEDQAVKAGARVRLTGKVLSVPVGPELVGRVVDPLGRPLDGKGLIKTSATGAIEKSAPGVIDRKSVHEPILTGITAIDAMIPIGRGQRELIIGDRGTGKTAIAIDTIINQTKEKTGVICIYVAIGQRTSRIAQIVDTLKKYKALENTVVVSADSSMPASLQYLAPYAGCAIGEYFMEKGKEAVIFYDDLTKHAWAYRELSLMLRRPSGREAYPGDVFYVHSRLLERACKLRKKRGGGSLTAFPFIETQAGDISAYIPTNVISITDGQIYLESDLFYSGVRPAINVGNSVSRVGGAAQIGAMKKVAGRLRLDLAQYRELSAFVQFASDLDEATRAQLDQGGKMVELLKQGQFVPLPVEEQIVVIWAGTSGLLQHLTTENMQGFEKKYLAYMRDYGKHVLSDIRKEKKMTDKIVKDLEQVTGEFVAQEYPKKTS